MQLVGRVLWWSDRDGRGVIVDPTGNEFYFDKSVITDIGNRVVERNQFVLFEYNQKISDCLCAHKVAIATKSTYKKLREEFLLETLTFDEQPMRRDNVRNI